MANAGVSSVPHFAVALRAGAWALTTTLGLGLMLLAMSGNPPIAGELFAGTLAALLAALGALGALGSFRALPDEAAAGAAVAGRRLLPPLAALGASSALLVLLLRAAVQGVLPFQEGLLALCVPLLSLGFMLGVYGCAERLGVFAGNAAPPFWRRHGFWLMVVSCLIQLPLLGSFGLIDPWETHYGEVAREMLARNDWISLWWAQDGWFWSKPILNFWLQGLSFALFGVQHEPDRMIQNVNDGLWPQPEWAVRLPIIALALLAQYALYVAARAYVGRRAAFFGSLVLATTPYWFLLARQSMADMPYVACSSAALAFVLLALKTDPEQRARSYELCLRFVRVRLSGFHLLFGGVLLLSLPQLVYLASRNLRFNWGTRPYGLRLHPDVVVSGSFGNCGLPGNAACAEDQASTLNLEPGLAALIWAACLVALLFLNRRERRLKRVYYLSAWLFAGLSFMAKGAPGLVLVLAVWLAFLVVSGRLGELLEGELVGLGLLTGCVVLPWFVQEYARHGAPFFERLFIHDMYKRAFDHVHDTNQASGDDTSFRYYIWQLGYGLFPWTGIIAASLLRAFGTSLFARPPTSAGATFSASVPASHATQFLVLWLLACFGMFSVTGTKYHHYILPLVPAAATLAGILLDELWQYATERASEGESAASPILAYLGLAASIVVALAGRDLVVDKKGDIEGQIRLLHLFTYNYERPWPKVLDFRWELAAFTLLAGLACLAVVVAPWRRAAVLALCGVGCTWSVWATDVYLVKAAPHWGQRETVTAYYRTRSGPDEPLVAYQLNWKGENFYTGNQLPAFVSSGKNFSNWVQGKKKEGVSVMFFTTEHSRISSLKRELGSVEKFELLTDDKLNNKFALARVVL